MKQPGHMTPGHPDYTTVPEWAKPPEKNDIVSPAKIPTSFQDAMDAVQKRRPGRPRKNP